jgi:hypothetical protein
LSIAVEVNYKVIVVPGVPITTNPEMLKIPEKVNYVVSEDIMNGVVVSAAAATSRLTA